MVSKHQSVGSYVQNQKYETRHDDQQQQRQQRQQQYQQQPKKKKNNIQNAKIQMKIRLWNDSIR